MLQCAQKTFKLNANFEGGLDVLNTSADATTCTFMTGFKRSLDYIEQLSVLCEEYTLVCLGT